MELVSDSGTNSNAVLFDHKGFPAPREDGEPVFLEVLALTVKQEPALHARVRATGCKNANR